MRFLDSHCHLTAAAFESDLAGTLERARGASVERIVTIASNTGDSRRALELARSHEALWCTAGVHPHDVGSGMNGVDMAALRETAVHPRCVAVGETGLDFFYDNAPRDAQRASFGRHVELAGELGLPLVVHSRGAEGDVAGVVRECAGRVKGVLHCFGGPRELLDEAMDAGWYVSFTGIASFPRFDEEVVRAVPRDRYMIETDAPYLAPVPKRGRRNEPSFVVHVAAAVARIRGEPVERVARDSWANGERFFGLPGADGEP